MGSSKFLIPLVLATVSSSCAMNTASTSGEKSIGDIQTSSGIKIDKNKPLPEVANAEVIKSLREYVSVAHNPAARQVALLRLADREAISGENLDIDGVMLVEEQSKNDDRFFNFSITQYESQLRDNPDDENNDDVMYQLSKAYDFKGDLKSSLKVLNKLVAQYPNSEYTEEVEFRRGELLFTFKDYDEASAAYDSVIKNYPDSKYFFHARYMKGWSMFKMSDYEPAFVYFTDLLEFTFKGGKQYKDLTSSKKQMIDDALRVMSITTAYLDGSKTLTDYFDKLGRRSYEYLVFSRLATHYMEKERYEDSAKTFYAYIENNPEDPRGPDMYVKMVDAYQAGNFPTQVSNEKEKFVIRYGIHSDYWLLQTQLQHDHLKPILVKYLESTAKHYHSMAQLPKHAKTHAILNKKAAQYYQEKIETQNAKDGDPKTYFLMAETLFDAGDFEKSVMMYEKVAYDMPKKKFKKKDAAGHGALLSYTELVNTSKDPEVKALWTKKRADGVRRFVKAYPKDRKVSGVMMLVTSEFYKAKAYEPAIAMGQDLVKFKYRKKSDNLNAWLVIAHSQYELKKYAESEKSYLQLTKITKKRSKKQKEMYELYSASIYKQGETKLAEKDVDGAIERYGYILKVAPNTKIRINAQYDLASLYIQKKDWPKAIKSLNDFRRRFPNHKLTKDVPGKILAGYEETKQWGKAAGELYALAKRTKNKEKKRQAIFQATEYVEKIGNDKKTLKAYKNYVNTYSQPFDEAMEARSKIAGVYQKQGDDKKRRFWLKDIIKKNDASNKQTVRSRYLAAEANQFFANEKFDVYAKIKLTQPLKKSMAKKRKALDSAMKAYEKTASYNVAEYVTAATFKIAEIYANLGSSLVDSQRPKGLNEMELEQYAILIEEEAYTFEELAIEVHENNAARVSNGIYDEWVKKSFNALSVLIPARYSRTEKQESFTNEIR